MANKNVELLASTGDLDKENTGKVENITQMHKETNAEKLGKLSKDLEDLLKGLYNKNKNKHKKGVEDVKKLNVRKYNVRKYNVKKHNVRKLKEENIYFLVNSKMRI